MRRSGIISAAEFKCLLLNLSLQIHSRKGMVAFKGWLNAHKQSTVCVFFIPGIFAHTVNNHTALLGGSGNNCSSGTHTESVKTSAVFWMTRQFIICRREQGGVPKTSVLRPVDMLLGVFYSCSHRKGFLNYFKTLFIYKFKSISCGVTDCKNQRVRFNIGGGTVGAFVGDPLNKSVCGYYINKLSVELDFTAQSYDFITEIFNNGF